MRRTAVFLGVALAVGIAVGAMGTQGLSAPQGPVERTVLLETDLAGMDGKEGFVILAEIAPGAVTGKHSHPAHEFAYVLEGDGTLEVEGKPPVPLKPGVAIHQPPGQVHNGKNASTTAVLKILAVYIAEKDQPLTAPAR
ncbi:MAG TPA: cupin domain-containing protein [Candidatus Methylomirabilis sp.]|nr:cupin domain-containing protein [Candidatus Methylomirabilis sp.]